MMASVSSSIAILNPKAGGGKAVRRWPAIEAALRSRGVTVEPRFTERPGHGIELARQALKNGADRVIAVGGDGTINEVANGFFENGRAIRPEAALGILPFGTGGDFQRTLKIPSDVEKAAEIFAAGAIRRIDVGLARLSGHDGLPVERYFVNLLSFGMGGDVSVRAKNFLSPLGGKIAFLYATVVVFLQYSGKTVRLYLDDSLQPVQFTITNIAIGNGEYHGGGMHPCPWAVLDDGLLEVTTIDRLSMFELLHDLSTLYSDDVYSHRKVNHFRVRTIRAESDEVVRIEVDGEALGRLPLEVEVLPQALPLVVPGDKAG